MNPKKFIYPETVAVLIGEGIGTAAMVVIFALLGRYDTSVLLGGVAGALIAFVNFFLMALGTSLAADKAEKQDVKGGQALIQMSYIGRMALLFLVLVLCAKSGKCNVLALVIPLVFVRPALSIAEILKKKGDRKA